MGDFNINLLNLDSDGKVKDFVDFMYFIQYVCSHHETYPYNHHYCIFD